MSEISNARKRTERAITHLEKALDKRLGAERALREEAADLRQAQKDTTERLDAAIARLRTLLAT